MLIQKKLLVLSFAFLLVVQANTHPVVDSITTISINAIGGLQYDLVRFKVKPGAKVRINLTNKDDMNHNLVITAPGTRLEVVNAALKLGNSALKMNYVPKVPEVLWTTQILGPGETKSITFTAPLKAGVYPYVCTYPGHGFVMFGAMYVTDKAMPAIKDDPNIPPNRKSDKVVDNSTLQNHHEVLKAAHPYKEIPPYMYRIFIPDASPAAIAVNLPHK